MKTDWPLKKLGDIASINAGGTPSRTRSDYWGGNIPWVKISEMLNDPVLTTEEMITKEGLENSSAKIFKRGTILLSIFATVGRISELGIDASTNQAIAGIYPHGDIDRTFLKYYLTAISGIIVKKGRGGAQSNINLSILKDQTIVVPPLEKQKKIVERLNAIRRAQELNSRLITKTQELYESDLAKELNSGIAEIKKLTDVCDVRDGTHDSPTYYDQGVPLVTSKNLKETGIDFEDVNFISNKDHEQISKRSKVDNGDILYGMIGTIGNPVLVNKIREFSIKNVGLIKFTKSSIDNRFVYYFLCSSLVKSQVKKFARGGTQKFVSLGNLRDIKIPVPTQQVQKSIVEKLDAIQNYKNLLRAQRKLYQELFDSVLHKSLAGELD